MDSSSAAEIEPVEKKKIKCNNYFLEDNADDGFYMTPANKLCEHELLSIFANSWISTKDLLNFRLVNKNWRDAATVTLLNRDSCYVVLDLNRFDPEDDDDDEDNKYYTGRPRKGPSRSLCTKLTTLISSSSKFPTSHVRIRSSPYYATEYSNYPDLILLFKLHGEKFKTLGPHGCVSQKQLEDIFFIFTPKLECLDLSKARLVLSALEETKKDKKDLTSKSNVLSEWTPKEVLPIKSLILGRCFEKCSEGNEQIMPFLLSSPSNLTSIQNVNLMSVTYILEEDQGHLVKSFLYSSSHAHPALYTIPIHKLFSATNPTLTKLLLKIQIMEDLDLFLETLPFINELMESSKETLQDLNILTDSTIHFGSEHRLKIPPMQNLKSIILDGIFGCYFHEDAEQEEDDTEPEVGSIFAFQDQVSSDEYFPSLSKVSLKNQELTLTSDGNIMCFFTIKPDNQDSTDSSRRRDCWPKVKILEVHKSILPDKICDARFISEVFPNITSLKISWFSEGDYGQVVNSSLWTFCPKVEFLQIYDISIEMEADTTSSIDTFFTGFPIGICQKLQREDCPREMENPASLKFLRIMPSVCDLTHLKELKLKFSKLSRAQFASPVTGAYAFSRMPNAKFIISYDPRKYYGRGRYPVGYDSDEEIYCVDEGAKGDADQESCFASIKPYVQIVQEFRFQL